MIKKLIMSPFRMLRSLISLVVFGQLQGWKLIGLYLITVSLSAVISFNIIDDDYHDELRAHQSKLVSIKDTLARKQEKAANYKRIRVELGSVMNDQGIMDNDDFCIFKLEKFSKSDAFKNASQAEKNKYNKEWQDCISKEAVLKDIDDFYTRNIALFEPYESIDNALNVLSMRTRQQKNIGAVSYHAFAPDDLDLWQTVAVKLSFKSSPETALSYMSSINEHCSNCVVQLSETSPVADSKSYQVSLLIILYLLPDDDKNFKEYSKQLSKKISDGVFSGDDLASLK